MKTLDNLLDINSDTVTANQLLIDSKMWVITQDFQFPQVQNGVITIPSGISLYIIGDFDTLGRSFSFEGPASLIGNSSEVSTLRTSITPTSLALFSSTFTLSIRNITLACPDDCSIFDLNGDGTNGIDFFGVNFGSASITCGYLGTIANYSNIILESCASLNTFEGIIISGTVGTLGINNCLFTFLTGNITTTQFILDNLTVSRRIRITNSSFIGGKCFSISGISISDERFIIDTVNFTESGDPVFPEYSTTSNRFVVTNTIGIANTARLGEVYAQANATSTAIASINVFYKASFSSTTLSGLSQKFTMSTTNRIDYVGASTRTFLVHASMTVTSGNNHSIGMSLFKNGSPYSNTVTTTTSSSGRSENVCLSSLVEMDPTDYLELFVKNSTATTAIVVRDYDITIIGV